MTPTDAVARAAAAIDYAENSCVHPEKAQVYLQAADRWLGLALALADNSNLIEKTQTGAARAH